jgi:hypothetical protein
VVHWENHCHASDLQFGVTKEIEPGIRKSAAFWLHSAGGHFAISLKFIIKKLEGNSGLLLPSAKSGPQACVGILYGASGYTQLILIYVARSRGTRHR